MQKTLIFLMIAAIFSLTGVTVHAADTELSEVKVVGQRVNMGDVLEGEAISRKQVSTSDMAQLLDGVPGVSFYTGGGVSALPVVNGFADDRLNILVDGVRMTSSCSNHMNPPLSYIAPVSIRRISTYAGITPVSLGGDSIGSTVTVHSADPVFAANGEKFKAGGSVGTFYRSNGDASEFNGRISLATENVGFAYSGSTVKSQNYKDGNGRTVRSTEYVARNQLLTLGVKLGEDLLRLDIGWQDIPRQAYANQYMDMVSNRSLSLNASYRGIFSWGELEARAYRQRVRHKMDMLKDKADLGRQMPMDTRGVDSGYSVQGNIGLSARDTLRIGHEYHHYTLDDWWPPLVGSMMMGPNVFWNINDGKRDRLALFGEWEREWDSAWSTLFGVRGEQVTMDTGDVQGYFATGDAMIGMMMGMMGLADGTIYQSDANAFNARDHKRTDRNFDLTALLRYESSDASRYEFGYARKTRSPNMYERFAWSNESAMAGAMITWFGDGNAYVGNLDLKPEVANTLQVSADWHDADRKVWQFRVVPYYTYVQDYINVEVNTNTTLPATFAALRFVNHDAQLYGANVSGNVLLGHAAGEWQAHGIVSYVNGRDLDSDTDLYHMMPLNTTLTLAHKFGGWSNALEWQFVAAKTKVDKLRQEQKTAAYGLVNLRSGYQWRQVRLDASIENLLNRGYDLPLGGVNMYAYSATGRRIPVAGRGRSVNIGLTLDF